MLVIRRLAEPHGRPDLKFFHLALLIPVVTALAGCETVQGYVAEWTGSRSEPRVNRRVGPELAPAPLPRYAVGRSFAFDDGRRETVLRVRGELLTWRKNRFSTAVAYRNFLIPSLSWESRTRKSRSRITAPARMLWPLRVGNDQRFEVTQIVEAKGDARPRGGKARSEFKHSWRCVVERTERLTVPAGTFDTYRISCFRYRPGTTIWRQTRIYHYAPRVGHFISRQDIYASRPGRRIKLTKSSLDRTTVPRSR